MSSSKYYSDMLMSLLEPTEFHPTDIEQAAKSTLTALVIDSKREIKNGKVTNDAVLTGMFTKYHQIWQAVCNEFNNAHPEYSLDDYAYARYVLAACGDKVAETWRPARIVLKWKRSEL